MPKINEKLEINEFLGKTNIRQNIINWYDFKINSNILEIGTEYGIIVDFFKDKEINFTSLEIDEEMYNYTEEKIKNFDNIKLVKENLIDFSNKTVDKFDYILITTSMDRLDKFVLEPQSDEAVLKLLEICKNLLSENGIILMAINNKFGIKTFSGAKLNSNYNSFDVLSGKAKNMSIYSKNEIIRYIKQAGFSEYNFYYPFPDFKLPSVIYSESYLPNKNSSKLNYLLYYDINDIIIFNEREVLKEIVKDGMLDFFSNSYFIEISNSKVNFSSVKFVSYNNTRKRCYNLITKLYENYAEKTNLYSEGSKHVQNIGKYSDMLKGYGFDIIDELKDEKIYSKYQTLDTLNRVLCNCIFANKIEEALNLIDRWFETISERFSNIKLTSINYEDTIFNKFNVDLDNEKMSKLAFVEYGFFDIVFENIFVEVNEKNEFEKFLVYDQEWCEKNVPLKFIMYRALRNFYCYNSKISEYIDIEKLYVKYNIQDYIDIFDELEHKIQSSIVDEEVNNEYQKTYAASTTLESLDNSLKYYQNELQKSTCNYNVLLTQVEETNKNWQAELDKVYNELETEKNKSLVYRIKKNFRKSK